MSHIPAKSTDIQPDGSNPFDALDRCVHSVLAEQTLGISPIAAARALYDWTAHLQIAPGKQASLALQAFVGAARLGDYALRSALDPETAPVFQPAQGDRRFAGEGWNQWPYNRAIQFWS
jgi:polyhydroxyalkanoate synthase